MPELPEVETTRRGVDPLVSRAFAGGFYEVRDPRCAGRLSCRPGPGRSAASFRSHRTAPNTCCSYSSRRCAHPASGYVRQPAGLWRADAPYPEARSSGAATSRATGPCDCTIRGDLAAPTGSQRTAGRLIRSEAASWHRLLCEPRVSSRWNPASDGSYLKTRARGAGWQ